MGDPVSLKEWANEIETLRAQLATANETISRLKQRLGIAEAASLPELMAAMECKECVQLEAELQQFKDRCAR